VNAFAGVTVVSNRSDNCWQHAAMATIPANNCHSSCTQLSSPHITVIPAPVIPANAKISSLFPTQEETQNIPAEVYPCESQKHYR